MAERTAEESMAEYAMAERTAEESMAEYAMAERMAEESMAEYVMAERMAEESMAEKAMAGSELVITVSAVEVTTTTEAAMLVVMTLYDGGNTRSRCRRRVIAEMPKLSKVMSAMAAVVVEPAGRGTVSTVVMLVEPERD